MLLQAQINSQGVLFKCSFAPLLLGCSQHALGTPTRSAGWEMYRFSEAGLWTDMSRLLLAPESPRSWTERQRHRDRDGPGEPSGPASSRCSSSAGQCVRDPAAATEAALGTWEWKRL